MTITSQPGINACEPRTVFTVVGCADGVAWERVITQANGVRWYNRSTGAISLTEPIGFELGECPPTATSPGTDSGEIVASQDLVHVLAATTGTYVALSNNEEVVLPPPSAGNTNWKYTVKRANNAVFPTNVVGHIDGTASSALLIQAGQARTFQSDGTTWWVI